MGKNARPDLPWADAPFLLALSRGRSFSAAAAELGVDRTTVARRLDRLETQFGTKLFERQSGQLELSQDGRKIMSSVERAEQELSQLNADQGDHRFGYGKVRISLSEHVLAGFSHQLVQFINDHPQVFLELTTSDRFVDLYKYEADILLRIARAPPEKLQSIDLGAVTFELYRRADQTDAAQSFLALPGQTDISSMMEGATPSETAIAAVDGVLATRDMILAGGGSGILPKFLGHCDPRLSPCPGRLRPDTFRLTMSCLPEQRNLHRIRIVMKDLSGLIGQALGNLNAKD
ncbi:DNA-binding transcriptional regulator, LysR family [Jannaschia faecimaris]|uniref:DNA-binding transcriptional regulator, LysR family n=1 Tax=Jannaschia faecimaris TaxID=1244108 RepID=A0A1H3U4V1_9RHOB|nr:LysR family transcriptional regulator [Jannaschia faecimaris]SDZ56549.1 DNA-binding transcriptional regulator, LysR family [Jannaschia faecimaris]